MAVGLVGSTTTVAVSGTFFAFLAWKRDALMVSFFIGSIANGILSKLLKRIINQTRPADLDDNSDSNNNNRPSDMGMPSSHAMSLGFIGTFTSLILPWTQLPILLYAVVSLLYRVQIRLHTWQQVVVGSIVGTANGYCWYQLCCTHLVLHPTNGMELVAHHLLNDHGLLPVPMLIVPALVGAMTVGSVERKIRAFFWPKVRKETKDP
jgi:PAP2 superfamily